MPCSLRLPLSLSLIAHTMSFMCPKNNKEHTYFQFGVIHTQDSEEAERWLGEDGRVMWKFLR
ncbi:MAG: hypothetical protein CM15mP125_0840 [Gammaproteobacteria bacterium]|nr:MAG: hypothetical protein CM15mP125_0840 [Gammaproteobacteria bacterium]